MLEDCQVVKENDSKYVNAMRSVLEAEKRFKEEQKLKLENELSDLSNKLNN